MFFPMTQASVHYTVTGILDTHACEVLALGHTSLPTRDEVGLMSTRRNP